jgi:TM2 domain-containing membrane protein YozV
MQQANSGTAYLFWCLWLFGIGGAQRLYTGHIASGLLYFCTWGLFGIGQIIDLALIPNMVDRRNIYLRGLQAGAPGVNPHITLNIGDIPQLQQLQTQLTPPTAISPMQKLLKAAKEHGGQLSLAQAAIYTELEPEQVRDLLQEATKVGYAEINNDPKTGAIRYHFDL